MELSLLLALSGLALVLLRVLNSLVVRPVLRARKARALGCGRVPVEPRRWPLGIDVVRAGLRADREQRTPLFMEDRFRAMGRYTFAIDLLGTANLVTAEPRNVQAVLAGQFADFAMGRARRTVLRAVLGRSIFAADGAAWRAAREAVRPLFARENVADLALLERHVQALLACLEGPGVDADGWTAPVGLAGLFPCLTIDSATELFLGRGTRALAARLRGDPPPAFDGAFGRVQATLSTRLRLRGLWWAYGGRALRACMRVLDAFVDDAVAGADAHAHAASGKRAGGTRYDYLQTLRARCADRAEVREQVLGLLAAGRDTTAGLLSWVFYCLVRNRRVLARLRAVVLAEFGPYEAAAAAAGHEAITFQRLKGCRYLQHVLSETLRLHSIVAFNSRMAVRDTTLPTGGGPGGDLPVFVPAGTEVNFSTFVMHRRADLWGEDAGEFVPERWEAARPGWNYAAFNGGPRVCIGQQFALTEAGYCLVRMLQRYDDIEGLDVDPTRDYYHFTIVSAPGTPNQGEDAVKCRLRVARQD